MTCRGEACHFNGTTVLALDADSVDGVHLQLSAHGRSSIGWSPILEGHSEYRSRQRACLSAQLTMPDVTVPIRGNVTAHVHAVSWNCVLS